MAEETKTEETKGKVAEKVKMILKMLLGIALVIVGIGLVWIWRQDVLALIRGGIGLVVILAGIIAIAIARE